MSNLTLVIMLIVATLSFSMIQSARAATPCRGFGRNFSGIDGIPMTHWGVKARINTMLPALCSGANNPNSSSSVWVMMTGGDTCQYAQSGYIRRKGVSTVFYFAEYSQDCLSFTYKETDVASSTHTYQVKYNFSTGKIHMYVDTTLLLTTNFDAGVNWTPGWNPEWEGETHDPGDDVSGTPSNPVYFSIMGIITSRGGPWVTPSGLTGSSTSTRYGFAWNITNSKFRIWTK
jgi:hypothetical protein